MTYLLLRADRFGTALADDPVVPAAEVPALTDAMALLRSAEALHDDAEAVVAQAREAGHAEGFEAGRQQGLAAGEADLRADLFDRALRERGLLKERQDAIATLALEVVRRVIGELEPGIATAALVMRAVQAVAPDTAARVRVAPEVADAVAARLRERPGLAVEADDTLDPLDAVIETALGRSHAGLETQLAQIERRWTADHGG